MEPTTTTIDPINELYKFAHLGNIDTYYKAKRKPLTSAQIRTNLSFIKTAIERIGSSEAGNQGVENERRLADPLWPLTSVKKILNTKTLPTTNEAIIVLAYCVTDIPSDILRHGIYAAIPDLLPKAEDFFRFIYHSSNLHGGKGFGRGLRTAISKWYNKKTSLDFAEMIGRNRSHNGWSHTDIIALSHTIFTELDKKAIKGVACKRGYQVVRRQNQLQTRDDLPGLNRLYHVSLLKICENEQDAADMIKLHSFKIENVPAHLMKSAKVWEALLPTLSYEQLIHYIPFLNDNVLLNPSEKFAKKFCIALGNMTLMTESKLHAIDLLIQMQSHLKQKRYSEYVSESYREKNIKNRNIQVNPHLVKRLQVAINILFPSLPCTGLRHFITIDLRRSAFEKPVFGSCTALSTADVSIIMALSIFKREKGTQVMSFSDVPGELINVPFSKEMTHERAIELCRSLSRNNTRHDLGLPVMKALHTKNGKFDVFMTFVDSIKRSVGNGVPPKTEFKAYKEKHKKKQLKYIFFNLARAKNDLKIDSNSFDNRGMLEVVGFSVKVPILIEAFLKNQFY